MVYVGVDLHRKSSHVAVLAGHGELLASRRIPSQPDEFLRVFGELEAQPVGVAFEATYGWGLFADLLSDVGIPAHMAHPLATKTISSARVKNDRVDASTLAHLLRTDLLPESWAAPPEVRDARKLGRTRVSLARISSRLKCQTHVLLADQAITPPVSDIFGLGGRRFLQDVRLRPIPQARLEANLRLIALLGPELAQADRELRELFRGDLRVARLVPIPGIGFMTAAGSSPRSGASRASPHRRTCARGPGSPPPSAAAPSTPAAATSPSRDRAGCDGRWWNRPPVRT
jgi:Transposase